MEVRRWMRGREVRFGFFQRSRMTSQMMSSNKQANITLSVTPMDTPHATACAESVYKIRRIE